MAYDYDGLLKLAYEIEGLLLLARERKETDHDIMDTMICDKIRELYDCTSSKVQPAATPQTLPAEQNDDETAASAIAEEEMLAEGTPDTGQKDSADSKSTQTLECGCNTCHISPEDPSTPVTLDEKLARDRAKDIFKAFTLNDKFRYRRNLFHDSQEEFDETLSVISGMSSFAEAEEYFYDDLCWDIDNEDVREFMAIVAKHF